jgi:ketosteroid isomerase-like protein
MATRETLFADIDSMEADRFAQHLAEDVTMQFGNAPPIHGRDACRETWAQFCATLDGVRHEVLGFWDVGEAAINEANVTYTRKDGREVTVPVATVYRPGGSELIRDYRIFIDLAPLFAE